MDFYVSGKTLTVSDCIILNTTSNLAGNDVKMFAAWDSSGSRVSATFKLDYNWWGHNSTNKGSLTPVVPAKPMGTTTLNYWRYLSADTNVTGYDILLKNETVLMNYNLNHYAGSSSGVKSGNLPTIS